jgi:tetratricopeptide (TPR) repeat protein
MNKRVMGVLAAAVFAGAALSGCREQPDDQQTGSLTGEEVKAVRADWPAGVSALVDSGNAAYSAKNYDAARRHYQEALRLADDMKEPKVTAYFGLYMVEHAVGDSTAAAAAMQQAQALAPEASLMHGMPGDSLRQAAPRTPQDSIHQRRN